MKTKLLGLLFCALASPPCFSDGSSIGKIYLPYVQPLEKEIEYQALIEKDNTEYQQQVTKHKLGVGASLTDKIYAELYVKYLDAQERKLDAYEFELRYQLTEQGEYASDWGAMLEVEKRDDLDNWELAIGILNTKDWQKWQFTTNFFLVREWGENIPTEMETKLALQSKYRYSALFEPGIEFFISEGSRAIGPNFSGQIKTSHNNKFLWELGVLAGLNSDTPDANVKLIVEYEFY